MGSVRNNNKETKTSEIIPAESGPIKADRHQTYHVALCSCGGTVYFFRMEKYSNCIYCGNWVPKPKNGKAITI